jgi:hypothetical protein
MPQGDWQLPGQGYRQTGHALSTSLQVRQRLAALRRAASRACPPLPDASKRPSPPSTLMPSRINHATLTVTAAIEAMTLWTGRDEARRSDYKRSPESAIPPHRAVITGCNACSAQPARQWLSEWPSGAWVITSGRSRPSGPGWQGEGSAGEGRNWPRVDRTVARHRPPHPAGAHWGAALSTATAKGGSASQFQDRVHLDVRTLG